MGKLDGKTAVITGANSGIGLAAAKLFAQEGARLFITGRRQAELDAAVSDIGGDTTGIQGDVTKLEDLDRLYQTVSQGGVAIDILFVNAGGGSFAALGDITEAHYDTTFNTNVKATLFTVQKALPHLRDGASVILTGSSVSISGTPAFSVYSATKAAIRNFARSWILDLRDRKIRVNVVSPGPTSTPGLHGLVSNADQVRAMEASMVASIPLARMGTPNEVAKAALFLASEESSFINGVELFVDGGMVQV